jgi:hypothetical protein
MRKALGFLTRSWTKEFGHSYSQGIPGELFAIVSNGTTSSLTVVVQELIKNLIKTGNTP